MLCVRLVTVTGQNGSGQNGTILYFVYILIQFNSIYT